MSQTPFFKAFVTNLTKYAEGNLIGEWVSFPTDRETMQGVFQRIGLDHGGEYFITDYDPSLSLSGILGEHENLNELNYFASKLEDIDFDGNFEKFSAALELGDHTDSVKDLINLTDNLDAYTWYPDITTEEEYGRYLVDECEAMPVLSEHPELEPYFDYEAFGHDTTINESGTFTEDGYIVRDSDNFVEEYQSVKDIPEEYMITPEVSGETLTEAAAEMSMML